MMESKEAEDRLLVALLLRSRKLSFGFHEIDELAASALPDSDPAFVELIVELLLGQELVAVPSEDQWDRIALTGRGLRVSEAKIGASPELGAAFLAPASDRYVMISHNQQAEISGDLGTLKEAVRGSNDAAEVDREIAMKSRFLRRRLFHPVPRLT
jgi:hypothetical protein